MDAYQLKVTIKESKPPIWRRVIVPAGISFSQLTVILHTAIGWEGYHLSEYSFYNDRTRFIENADEEDFGPFGWNEWETLDSSEYLIDDFFDEVKSFTYTYDFGDNWEHKVEIEKVIYDYPKNYPEVIKFKGNTPPEDCGGMWGYDNLLEAIKDPEHPEHEEMKDWYGDPEDHTYDMSEVNARLCSMVRSEELTPPISEVDLYRQFEKGDFSLRQVEADDFDFDFDDFDDDDFDDDDFDDFEAAAQVGFFSGLAHAVTCMRLNGNMKDDEILRILSLDEEEWAAIGEIIEVSFGQTGTLS